jgi:hypothetical protein
MPTTNLFLLTQTLQRLLNLNVRALLAREGQNLNLNVSAMPPERVGSETNTLNLYLYHVMEDPHHKNDPPPGAGSPAVARQPLVLSLYYILTAHHQVNDVFDAQIQQLLFGLAMKTMHDHPQLRDTLAISPGGGAPAELVMPGALVGRDNRFDIALRQLTPEEALGFWHADDTSTTRLSAYYEVRTVALEPEPALGAQGTVFDIGLFVSAGQAPRLDRAAGLVQFTPPPASGIGPQLIETAPARATLAPGLAAGPVNRITLAGAGLAGDGARGAARVVLRSPRWRTLVPPVRVARIDPVLNPQWAATLDDSHASFEMHGTLEIVSDGGSPVTLKITPGIYAVSVETVRRMETRAALSRTTVSESNQIAFSLGARIDRADPLNPAGRFVVRVVNLFDMLAPDLDALLAVDGAVYEETAAFSGNAANDRGLFQRLAGAAEFHPLFDPAIAGAHPVRLVINGAESQPFWIETT